MPQRPSAPMPTGPPAPTATGRAPIRTPFHTKLMNACGGFWDVFPWIGLALYAFLLWGQYGAPPIVGLIALLVYLVWLPLYVLWIICDVMAMNTGWWWALLGILCYPIGLFLYLMMGRN